VTVKGRFGGYDLMLAEGREEPEAGGRVFAQVAEKAVILYLSIKPRFGG
jgi:hypothetical protein